MKNKLDRKMVEIGKKRIPLRSLIHNKPIREAAKALEDARLHFNEQEIMLGAKLIVKWETGGDAYLYALRLETDNEYNRRLEEARKAEEAKAERARIRKLQEAERAKKAQIMRKQNAFETIIRTAQENGLSAKELAELVKSLG
jgi:RPA family protein